MKLSEKHLKRLSPQELLDLYEQNETENKQYWEAVISTIPDLMFLVDDRGRYIDVFATGKEHLLLKNKEEIIGKHVTDFFNEDLSAQFMALIQKAIATHSLQRIEYALNIKDFTEYYEARVMPTPIKRDGRDTVLALVRDVSEVHISKAKMQYLATHDTLTSLPNRALIFEHLNHTIANAKRNDTKGSLLFIDIDGFKDINDNYSHNAGDQLLKEFAHRLIQITRESDIVGRLSGDEFVVVLENVNEMDDILGTVDKIQSQLTKPFFLKDQKVHITVSIGIACYPIDGENADQLIYAADQAMYEVKKHGKNSFTFYRKEFSLVSNEYFNIQDAIRKAITEDDFYIVYQPQFSLKTGKLTGIEALLRSNNTILRSVPVSRLITIAEESNIIHNISRFVMQRCCQQIKVWQDMSLASLKIAVNLSRKELSDESIVPVIKDNLSACNIAPGILEFEITESTLLQNNHIAKMNIEQLRDLGCSFSIDDYGTGFSSLTNLREFHLDKIKIDKSFIDDLEKNENDQIIVSATISMIKQLGLIVLAEGVENEAQANLLRSYGCDEVQGYHYAYPLSAEEMTSLLLKEQKSVQ